MMRQLSAHLPTTDAQFMVGAGNRIALANPVAASSAYAVVEYTGSSALAVFSGGTGNTFVPLGQIGSSSGELSRINAVNNGGGTMYLDGDSTALGSTRASVRSAFTSEHIFSIDSLPAYTGPGFSVGDNTANNLWDFIGTVKDIIMISGDLSAADREMLEGYLAHKHGLAANLPSAHPYLSVAP